jgi:hypothetical protein
MIFLIHFGKLNLFVDEDLSNSIMFNQNVSMIVDCFKKASLSWISLLDGFLLKIRFCLNISSILGY